MNSEIQNRELLYFCRNVKWLRRNLGFSKSKMAEIMGIGISSITKLELGEVPSRLSIDAVLNLAFFCNISPSVLFSKCFEE